MADSQEVNRRLTVILAADAVGYSKMMSRDEEGTIRTLEGHRKITDTLIAAHGGRIISTAGDSVLAEFTSAVAAVRCATEMQDALKTRNDKLPEDRQMLFRVGVNLGDVVVKGNDLLGDGVNVAARLESIAEPGGVCIASSVYDQITGKLDLGFTDMGEQNLKNITRPVRAYQVGGSRPLIATVVPGYAAAALPPPDVARRSSLPLVLGGLVVLALAVVGVLAAVAWDRGWFGTSAKAPAPSTPAVASALPARPAPAAPASAAPPPQSSSGPKTDSTFAALAAGEAAPPSKSMPAAEWVATFSCAAYRDIPAGTTSSRASFRDGEFLVEPGARGQQSHWRLSGRPARDNSLVLTGENARFNGRLSGDRYVLDGRLGPRSCSLTLAR